MSRDAETTIMGEAAFFVPGYECNSPVAPSDFNFLMPGYRLKVIETALWGDPLLYCIPTHAMVKMQGFVSAA